MTALALLCGWLAALVALVAALALRRPTPAPAPADTFNEHAATAAALLRPDHPIFTEADEARFAAEWLAYVDSLPTTTDREYR